MIFQDPMTSLNPVHADLEAVDGDDASCISATRKEQAYEHAIKMLEMVGIPDARARVDSYPHEFSGGMRQRVMIAMALVVRARSC